MNTASNDIIRGRVGQDAGNNHTDQAYNDNITLVRPVRNAVIQLEKDEYYARMILDPNGGLKDRKGLEQCAGQTFISKFFNAVYMPPSNILQLWLVRVKNPKLCWVTL